MQSIDMEYVEWLRNEYLPISGGQDEGGDVGVSTTTQEPQTQEPVTETQGEPQGQVADDGVGATQTQEVRPYTDEEVQSILDADGKLDSRRLTPTQKLVQKSFERNYTPKYQQLAEQQRQLNQAMNQIAQERQLSKSPEEMAYREYQRNPMGVVQDFQGTLDQLYRVYNAQIAQQQGQDADTTLQKIRYLENTLKKFEVRGQTERGMKENFATLNAQAVQKIVQDIPDYQTIAPELSNHVMQNGKLDGRIMEAFTNAPLMDMMVKQLGISDLSGADVVKQLVSFVNYSYRLANAGKTAELKKTTPSQLAKAGSGMGSGGQSNVDMGKLMEEAKRTKDWSKYLKAKGAI